MSRGIQYLVMLSCVTFLTGCGIFGGSRTDSAGVEDRTGSGADSSTYGASAGSGFSGHPLDDPQGNLAARTIYFDFDRYDVKEEWLPVVNAHAGYLQSSASAAIRLEGHADERGSREYNQALGERRANAVYEMLVALGINGSRIARVSYGEERPVADCHDESCWSRNRRVEIIYTAR